MSNVISQSKLPQGFSEDDAIACLALWRCPRVGPATYRRVLNTLRQPAVFLDPRAVDALPDCVPSGVLDLLKDAQTRATLIASAESDWLWSQKNGRHIVFEQGTDYPEGLRPFTDSPPLLFAVGDLTVLTLPQVAIVGTRQPSESGRANAAQFARGVVEHGLVVTSGLALGIDGIAHDAAISAQGKTIAVLGNGLDRVYPKSHTPLARRMIENGSVLVSEFPLGVAPHRQNFPRRNRIMCGLSSGVLVVEAALKSGSLITARIAADQGKDVFAIPGTIHNLMARGCHQLIREGATLVESVADILTVLAPRLHQELQESKSTLGEHPHFSSVLPMAENVLANEETSQNVFVPVLPDISVLNPIERTVYEALDASPQSMDYLVSRTGMMPQELLTQLMLLELKDIVRTVPGGYQRAQAVAV